VIETLNRDFVAVEINITDQGFPKIDGLKPWEIAFDKKKSYKFGFATTAVLSPDGRQFFGHSGSGHLHEFETSTNYHPEKFLAYLKASHERFTRARQVVKDVEEDRPEKVREYVGWALEQIANPDSIVKLSVGATLQSIGAKLTPRMIDEIAKESAAKLEDKRAPVRGAAAMTLEKMAPSLKGELRESCAKAVREAIDREEDPSAKIAMIVCAASFR
jgi:hypothetical protein